MLSVYRLSGARGGRGLRYGLMNRPPLSDGADTPAFLSDEDVPFSVDTDRPVDLALLGERVPFSIAARRLYRSA